MAATQPVDVTLPHAPASAHAHDCAKTRPRSRLDLDDLAASVNQNGCFDSDRVLKCGHLQRRTQKTKKWKSVYMVLRPNALFMYKNEKETKLRHQIHLSDLTAVAFLKDPKHKREHVFGLFSPSKNFHFQAPTAKEAEEWVDKIRREARIDEEEEEMFLAGKVSCNATASGRRMSLRRDGQILLSSSPETPGTPMPIFASLGQRDSCFGDSSGMSGNELPSHSDASDNEGQRLSSALAESLAFKGASKAGSSRTREPAMHAPAPGSRYSGQGNLRNVPSTENDPDRVIWQGWLWMLRSKGGVRQWKDMWGVLRPRNLILYKDESEYTAQWIAQLSNVVSVVDIDPLSKNKVNCLQIILEEKSFRFCSHDEESLVQLIGAFKSLLVKRRSQEARAATDRQ
ncbi:hypothetical protein CDD81_811 [Ophiocordyceps australis]|uniref:PH domain-containing protein n=1 Tax=Ophiocordyceps australis TaxID=1399860 RepID=A0A2C5Y066_9HYPO|nr:hypothetical protein CDD81_811 [Ophiocordyceps australis]